MKICKKCKKNKDLSQYYKHPTSPDGVGTRCKVCIEAARKDRHQGNPDKRRLYNQQWRKDNLKKASEHVRKWQKSNPDKVKINKRIYRLKYPEKVAVISSKAARKYRLKNPEKFKIYRKTYQQNHPAQTQESAARYRARKIKRTPNWLTIDQLEIMKSFYITSVSLTKEDGVKRHVDHIIPLNHPLVSGLHVPWNLQILTSNDNCYKQNTFDGTYENESWKSCIYNSSSNNH